MSVAQPLNHPAFSFVREHYISSLNVTVQEFQHIKTGAQHIHMQAESDENVFLVALRTVPEDSTGVAHILEHTALCGSKKYPVRDPFFMMTRRSLNTFMNAFTSSDWTAYPIASLNKKDFNNLLDVYLDAVFFSRIDKLDFAQEGHRLEFEETTNTDSPLVFKGVVFNEMKGAMSSVSSQLWHTLTKYLFPTSTYQFNSGGEPEDIPDLSYEQLVDFYKTHYHPSNAIFMTFGDIPAKILQEKFETQALHAFDPLDKTIAVTSEKRYKAPIRIQEYYANNDDDISEQSHVLVAWLLGENTNLEDSLKAQLLSSVLMDNSASPLMHALESSDLGNAPSPLSGLDDSQKELSFICGLAGTAADSTNAVERLIFDTLQGIVDEGIAQSELESALHQLELHQREVGGDSYPYGLQLILKALTSANHRGDPVALLDLDAALEKLREEIKEPNFIQDLISNLLLANSHRVTLTLTPDQQLSARKEAAEKARLAQIKAQLSDAEKKVIVDQSLALTARQESVDDPGLLPKVTLDDVPEKERSVEPQITHFEDSQIARYISGTNGLVYQQTIYDLPALSTDETSYLPLYGNCVTELGAADMNYLEMQKRQSAISGGVSAFHSIRGGAEDVNKGKGFFVYSGKALNRNHNALSDLMRNIIDSARFDEYARIKEIVAQLRVGMEQSVTGNGHVLAMTAAASGISSPAKLSHTFSGLAAIQAIKSLDESLSDDEQIVVLAEKLRSLHEKITAQPSQLLVIGEAEALDNNQTAYEKLAANNTLASTYSFANFEPSVTKQAWICNSQVNFCAQAFPTVAMNHPDSAPLVVLGHYLRNGFLHKAIREQGGAYGGGASQDNGNACFRFYSYRDPRIEGTLSDFSESVAWLSNNAADKEKLEEAILGTISGIDRSESPAGKAKRCFHSELHDRDLETRQLFRARVLKTSLDDLVRVAQNYLRKDRASTAIITGKNKLDVVEGLNMDIVEL